MAVLVLGKRCWRDVVRTALGEVSSSSSLSWDGMERHLRLAQDLLYWIARKRLKLLEGKSRLWVGERAGEMKTMMRMRRMKSTAILFSVASSKEGASSHWQTAHLLIALAVVFQDTECSSVGLIFQTLHPRTQKADPLQQDKLIRYCFRPFLGPRRSPSYQNPSYLNSGNAIDRPKSATATESNLFVRVSNNLQSLESVHYSDTHPDRCLSKALLATL